MTVPISFGDIKIPWITSKDTSIEKETVSKTFINDHPQTYEVDEDLESGTYSAVLNKDSHNRDESLDEQMDAVQSMPYRNASEFPVEVGGDRGHVMVDTATTSITPSKAIRTSDLSLRVFEHEDYIPSISTHASPFLRNYNPTPVEGLLALPQDVETVERQDGTTISSDYTISTNDGDLNLYIYGSDREIFEYEHSPSGELYPFGENFGDVIDRNYGVDEEIAPVRVYRVNVDQTGEPEDRIYSGSQAMENSVIDNAIIRTRFNNTDTNKEIGFHEYQSGSAVKLFNIVLESGVCYMSEFSNYKTILDFVDSGYKCTSFKGYPAIRLSGNFNNNASFDIDFTYALSSGSSSGYYYSVSDDQNNDFVLIKTEETPTFSQSGNTITVSNLVEDGEYTLFFGIVPDNISTSDFARYVYNRGKWKRSLSQR